jgi:hypothetical protein
MQALCGDDGKMITEMRFTDGFVNATKMYAGKLPANFFQSTPLKPILSSSKLLSDRPWWKVVGDRHRYLSTHASPSNWLHSALSIRTQVTSDLVYRYMSEKYTLTMSRHVHRFLIVQVNVVHNSRGSACH